MKKLNIFLSLCFLTIVQSAYAQKKASQPNILWITCEDMSANLPFYGDATIKTPNLSQLALESVKYTRMFSVSGVCAPSRSAIVTGMYPTSIGTDNMRTETNYPDRKDIPNYEAVPPANVKCFTEYLRSAGYYCTNNNKTDYQFGDPFTAWDESSLKAHWRNRPQGKPFFSVFNIMRTHESQIWKHKNETLRVDPAKVTLPPYYPESPVIRRDMARYYDNIMVMDSIAGSLLRQLKEDGLLENTIVLFFSDHGAGLPWYKRELYDRGTNVPLLVRFPGKKYAGTTDTNLHSFVDLAPTVLSLTGIKIPGHIQGEAFLGEAKAAKPRSYIYAARDRMDEQYDMVRAVRDLRFKYIKNYQPEKLNYQDLTYRKQMDLMQEILKFKEAGKLNKIQQRWFEPKPAEELYDVQNDPFELSNLAGNPKYQKELERMRLVHEKWMKDVKDVGAVPEMEMVKIMRKGNAAVQPETPKPILKTENGPNAGEVKLTLSCPENGASIGYRTTKSNGKWLLYSKPLLLKKEGEVHVKAIRYGYKESEEETLKW